MLPFTLCADDYAESPEIDAGILQLLRQQRLGAVSCLVTSPRWPAAAAGLAAFAGRVDIGLHLNLTQAFTGPGLRAWPLPLLLLLAGLRCLPEAGIEREIERQVGLFQAALGRLPDYVDGHQHVQQLPQVRSALLRQVAAHWRGGSRPWIRVSRPRRWRGAKAALIGGLGGLGLQRQLLAAGLLCNPDFAGVYSLSPEADYRRLMQAWLAGLAPGGLIMCHPAQSTSHERLRAAAGWPPLPRSRAAALGRDGRLARARQQELAYLCSFDFEADCLAAGRLPVRFGRRLASAGQASGA